uniref:Uncharacterized protein n=1 Tax=Rhizophora mucronata TaxID=61149 RepID=A0A2P2PHY8_RHIMU
MIIEETAARAICIFMQKTTIAYLSSASCPILKRQLESENERVNQLKHKQYCWVNL